MYEEVANFSPWAFSAGAGRLFACFLLLQEHPTVHCYPRVGLISVARAVAIESRGNWPKRGVPIPTHNSLLKPSGNPEVGENSGGVFFEGTCSALVGDVLILS